MIWLILIITIFEIPVAIWSKGWKRALPIFYLVINVPLLILWGFGVIK